MVTVIASNTVQYQNNTEWAFTLNQGYALQLAKTVTTTQVLTGTWRISFDINGDPNCDYGGDAGAFGELYVAGIMVAFIIYDGCGYTNWSSDFAITNLPSGTVVQLKISTQDQEFVAPLIKNFQIKFDLLTYGNAAFTSNPSVARIWIDGVDKGVDTPATVTGIIAGTRNWTLKKTGYADVSGTCVVPTGGTVTVPLVTFLASAAFTSSPTTARIWIDSVDKGIDTPGTVTGITAGTRNFTLKKAAYLDYNSSFTATAGTTTTVPLATLTPSATTSVIIID